MERGTEQQLTARPRPRPGRARLRGVRGRTATATVVVVALALAGACVALVLLQRQQLTNGLADLARQQAAQVADQVRTNGARAVDLNAAGAGSSEQALIQVVAPDGTVVAASTDVDGEPVVSDAQPAAGEEIVQTLRRVPVSDDEPFVVVTTGVGTSDGVVRVVTARSLDSVDRSTAVLVTLLGIGYPVVVLVVGAAAFWLTGRALAPVERIRSRVAEISARDLSARVPVPATEDEIARLAETMNDMLARLDRSVAAQRRFVADASHELRSPLATIRAAAEVARSHPEALDWSEASATVLEETGRLERLVDDLLLLARSDEHGLVMRLHEVDLDDLLAEEVARMRRSTGQEVRLEVVPVRVQGDVAHLRRAIRNLIENAARYAVSGIDVRLRRDGATACIEVCDDGPGVAWSERERVFDRFVRLDDSRERGSGGAGLGLSITRQIARAHGGDVVLANPGRSVAPQSAQAQPHTVFLITLPIDPVADGEDDAP